MSGYLEVKYPFRSNLGLNPFKSWKRQWCILRPSPTSGVGSLAVYCSEAGASAGSVDLPSGCIVKRAKSRTRPHAFAIFSLEEPKPRVLLAAQSSREAQTWMDKIRDLLNGDKLLGTETLLKDSYSVTVIGTDLSRKCGLAADSVVTLSSTGVLVSHHQATATFVDWKHVSDVLLTRENGDKIRTCVLTVDSGYTQGGGEMKFATSLAAELVATVKQSLRTKETRKLSRSEGDLRSPKIDDMVEIRRSSWYSGPSEISLDDTDLIISKDCGVSGELTRYSGSGRLCGGAGPGHVTACPQPAAVTQCTGPGHVTACPQPTAVTQCTGAGQLAARARALLTALDDSTSDRRSVASISSGVYEEIAEGECPRDHTYESLECVYATMRRKRYPPPPLPPRQPAGSMKLGEPWECRVQAGGAGGPGGMGGPGGSDGVTRHSSLGSLPRYSHSQAKTLPKAKQPFSVFRKRLKSDSRILTSPKSETAKEKDVEPKKKKFDFTPTRDIFKSFKVSRKMKNLKITGLAKVETKSCECLDETQHVTTTRCSKSVECLENDEFDEIDSRLDDSDILTLPQEIVQLILRGRDQLTKIRLKDEQTENEYMPMSPIVPPPPIENHYIVMSPRTNLA